jgi:hypothetical protein
MVNFGFNSASILGIVLAVAGAGLYFMRSLRPEISRDHDIFFAAVGLLCGGILLWHGWRLDPILQFSQLLLAGSAVFFAVESLRLRGVATEQARRSPNSSYVDDERPVSRVYRAELAQNESYEDDYYEEEEEIPRRRLEGSRDRTSSRRNVYEEETPRTRRPSRRPATGYTQEPPSRRSRSSSTRVSRYDEWQDTPDHWEDQPQPSSRSGRRKSNLENEPANSRRTKKRRPKSPEDLLSSVGTEYVDYQPIDESPSDTYPDAETQEKPDPRPNSPDFDY